jgi:RNAse (barnase) inhibitor barstar
MNKKTYTIDGAAFKTLEEFYDEISAKLIPGAKWGKNLDAFDDILYGGFGTPDEGFVLVWLNSEMSRERLGYPETIRHLEKRLDRCHPDNIPYVAAELATAKLGEGSTVFDWLVDIIKAHCPGGEEEKNGVELILK